jgi:predicted N-acetyltransferase YhbS
MPNRSTAFQEYRILKMNRYQVQVERIVTAITLPAGIRIRAWVDADFATVQQLSTEEGWPTPEKRSSEALCAWRMSWPALVLVHEHHVIGFLRALTDEQVTTYIAEVLVASKWRGQGLGRALIEVCHRLYPSTRLDLLSTASADGFYQANGFRPFNGFRKSYQ